jgi:hypothetical protein
LSISFQADNDLKRIIVDAALRREPSVDFQTAQAARLDGLSDEKVLNLAALQGRILVSHDKRTMPLQMAAFVRNGGTSHGLFASPSGCAHTRCCRCVDPNLGGQPPERLDQPGSQNPALEGAHICHSTLGTQITDRAPPRNAAIPPQTFRDLRPFRCGYGRAFRNSVRVQRKYRIPPADASGTHRRCLASIARMT